MTHELRKLILTALSVVSLGAFFNSFDVDKRIHVQMPMRTNSWQAYTPLGNAQEKLGRDFQLTKSDAQFNSLTKTAVVLVSFTDMPISTTPEDWQALMYSKNNSVFDYYQEVSQGQWAVVPVLENEGVPNDGIIQVAVKLPHPNNKAVLTDSVYTAVFQAVQAAANQIDLSAIDGNGNKTIEPEELVWILVFAGYEDLYAKTDGLASSGFSHEIKRFGKINDFTMTEFVQIGELYYDQYNSQKDSMTTRGILVHELGHILGLPDLYDTDYSSQGVGIFSLMSNGDKLFTPGGKLGDAPVDMDPWSKIYLGFVEPEYATESGTYRIKSNKWGSPEALIIPTQNKGEYFVIENRYLENRDKALDLFSKPGGIMIWHVDENKIFERFYENIVNNDETWKGVDLEESSEALLNLSQLDTNDKGKLYEPFFRTHSQSVFNGESLPNSHLNNGLPSGISIKVLEDGYVAKIQIEFEK